MSQLKSLSKGLQVYKEIVNYGKPINASILCNRLKINKSTMSRILQTLKDEDYISYLDSNDIVAKPLEDDETKKTRIQLLIEKTKPLLEEIYEQTKECSYLGIIDENKLLYLNQIDYSDRKIKNRDSIGLQAPPYSNALGKSILAFGNYNLEKIKFNKYTDNTITDLNSLKQTLSKVLVNGYSLDIRECQDNMCCVAVPLFNHEGILLGAVGISGSQDRLSPEKLNYLGKEISNIVDKYTIIC